MLVLLLIVLSSPRLVLSIFGGAAVTPEVEQDRVPLARGPRALREHAVAEDKGGFCGGVMDAICHLLERESISPRSCY